MFWMLIAKEFIEIHKDSPDFNEAPLYHGVWGDAAALCVDLLHGSGMAGVALNYHGLAWPPIVVNHHSFLLAVCDISFQTLELGKTSCANHC